MYPHICVVKCYPPMIDEITSDAEPTLVESAGVSELEDAADEDADGAVDELV